MSERWLGIPEKTEIRAFANDTKRNIARLTSHSKSGRGEVASVAVDTSPHEKAAAFPFSFVARARAASSHSTRRPRQMDRSAE